MSNRYHLTEILLAAFMVWLVHSMVPHHHHGTALCFNMHHCQEAECVKGVSAEGTCHRHDHHENEDGCVLRQITFLPANQIKVIIQPVQTKPVPAIALIPDPEDPGHGCISLKERQFAGQPPGQSDNFHHSSGLRAPPAV